MRLKTGNENYDYNPPTWFETFSKGFVLYMTPLDVASLFQSHQQSLSGSWVFTSATLQVGQDFRHFAASFEDGLEVTPYEGILAL